MAAYVSDLQGKHLHIISEEWPSNLYNQFKNAYIAHCSIVLVDQNNNMLEITAFETDFAYACLVLADRAASERDLPSLTRRDVALLRDAIAHVDGLYVFPPDKIEELDKVGDILSDHLNGHAP